MMTNNILSYFIKDIKSAKERAFYTQISDNGMIQIFYKDELIYTMKKNDYSCNYINNKMKYWRYKYIATYKIFSNYHANYKYLYYKKDNQINIYNLNYITFYYLYIYNKYLNKRYFNYVNNNKDLLNISIVYFKKYKYIKHNNGMKQRKRSIKFTSPQILIPNKYELDYYCKFFNQY
jgi:hypothetical protein